jgi:putative transposase
MRRLKQLEDENARLKRIVADLALDREMLQDVHSAIGYNVPSALHFPDGATSPPS